MPTRVNYIVIDKDKVSGLGVSDKGDFEVEEFTAGECVSVLYTLNSDEQDIDEQMNEVNELLAESVITPSSNAIVVYSDWVDLFFWRC
ncbi:MAG: hypothetical protein ACRDBG_10370 [Waterburya sp.]